MVVIVALLFTAVRPRYKYHVITAVTTFLLIVLVMTQLHLRMLYEGAEKDLWGNIKWTTELVDRVYVATAVQYTSTVMLVVCFLLAIYYLGKDLTERATR